MSIGIRSFLFLFNSFLNSLNNFYIYCFYSSQGFIKSCNILCVRILVQLSTLMIRQKSLTPNLKLCSWWCSIWKKCFRSMKSGVRDSFSLKSLKMTLSVCLIFFHLTKLMKITAPDWLHKNYLNTLQMSKKSLVVQLRISHSTSITLSFAEMNFKVATSASVFKGTRKVINSKEFSDF